MRPHIPAAVVGTVGYMAPEQARGGQADARSDIFAFGVVLYEMLSGKRAFERGSAMDTLAAILKEDPPALPPVTPPGLDRVVRRCLEKKPEDRFSSARDLAFALEAVSGSGAGVSAPALPAFLSGSRRRWVLVAGVIGIFLLLAAVIFMVIHFGLGKKSQTKPFDHVKVSRLTQDGRAGGEAAISPDGRYVAYLVGDDKGRMGLWVQQVATSSAVQVVPPTESVIGNAMFSPDGNYVYYGSYPPTGNVSRLYRVAVLGGVQEPQAVEDIDTAPTFSPDGRRLAFVRGTSEGQSTPDRQHRRHRGKDVGHRRGPSVKPSWSPDGGTIAWVRNEGTRYFLQLVDVATGAMRTLGERTWDGAREVEWLPDGRGLLLVARDRSLSAEPQIWLVEYPSGSARPLTNDVGGYSTVGVSSDGKTLVSVRFETRSNIWVAPIEDPAKAIQVTSGNLNADGFDGLAWTPSGGLVYTSKAGGKPDLWILEKLGGQARRLTDDPFPETRPAVSPDGRTIVFGAVLPGAGRAIWRIERRRERPKADFPWTTGFGSGLHEGRTLGPLYRCGARSVPGAFHLTEGPRSRSAAGIPPRPSSSTVGLSARYHAMGSASRAGSGTKAGHISRSLPWTGMARESIWSPRSQMLQVRPSGRRVARASSTLPGPGGDIWRVGLDKTPPQRVTDLKGERVFQLAVSADGKQLAYARGQYNRDVVLIQQTEGE